MARGPKKHLKRLAAPTHWMLDKMGGVYAPRPNPGGHKLRESIPLILILRNRLKYALTGKESETICKQRLIKVDGKVRTEKNYPAGFMDVVSIPTTNESFRILYDVKGRFVLHSISTKESDFKLAKIIAKGSAKQNVNYVRTHDGRHIRFADPAVHVNDSVKIDIATGKITGFIKFEVGNLCTITGGKNRGRVGQIIQREAHEGSFEIIHVRDTSGAVFTTRISNVFIIGQGSNSEVTLPRGKGLKISTVEDRKRKLAKLRDAKKGKKISKKAPKTKSKVEAPVATEQ